MSLRECELHSLKFYFQELVIIDSFHMPLCQPIRNSRAKLLKNFANIGFNASKQMWFDGFKVHMAVTESGYILNYIVTPASVHDLQATKELLDGLELPYILADLGYLSETLRQDLERRGVTLWTPLRKNMLGANVHNNEKILAIRRTIETRFSTLCSEFDIEHPTAKSLAGIQLEIEREILAYNLGFFINWHQGYLYKFHYTSYQHAPLIVVISNAGCEFLPKEKTKDIIDAKNLCKIYRNELIYLQIENTLRTENF